MNAVAPAPVELPWPPLSVEDATAYRWAKIDELTHLDRVLARTTTRNTVRPRLLAERKLILRQIDNASAWIDRNRGVIAPASTDRFSDLDEAPPVGMRPMTNAEFLVHVRRQLASGHVGPVRRPLVRE